MNEWFLCGVLTELTPFFKKVRNNVAVEAVNIEEKLFAEE